MGDTTNERAECDAILSSTFFSGHTNSGRFLKYVCEKYFAGVDHLSEIDIAMEALGRRANFDPQEDSIVRVEAHRVRKRLEEYYALHGTKNSLRLVLPQGSYLPQFVPSTGKISQTENAGAEKSSATSVPDVQAAQPVKNRWKRGLVYAAAMLILIGSVVGGTIFYFHNSQLRRTALSMSGTRSSVVNPIPTSEILLMAGSSSGNYSDQLGHVWSSDQYYDGGESWFVRPRRILRTTDPQLFFSARQGQKFDYNIPLKPGYYELRLYFAETFYGDDNSEGGGESSRMFDVTANGVPLLKDFDPLSDAGGSNTADVRVFAGITPAADGMLHLHFQNHWILKGVAFVNAIQLTPTSGKTMLPIRWVAANSAIEDRRGNLWLPDQFSEGGRRRDLGEQVTNTGDSELYGSERYGNFTYAIPVAGNTSYTVILHFAEHWFGVPHFGGGGDATGKRVFDIFCNGIYLQHDLDIYRETGASLKALDKTFHGLRPNHQGKLLLSFIPNQDYASVSAIEVIPEQR